MNFLLSFNKKLILIILLLIILIIFFFIFTFYIKSNQSLSQKVIINKSSADIAKPKFSINSNKQKILVTASEGNFITEDEIMLEKNVVFKSKKFKIYSDNVVFNKKTLVASSKNKSKFIAKKTSIDSEGFDIIENGNIINFKGQTKLTLKWINFLFFFY